MLTEEQKKRREAADAAEKYVVDTINKKCREVHTVSIGSHWSKVDGLLMERHTHEIIGVYEIKCRNISFADVVKKYDCELIIDRHKLDALQAVSAAMRVPSYVYTYLMGDGVIYRSPITNEYGDWVCNKRDEQVTAPLNLGGMPGPKEVTQVMLDGGTVLSTHEQLGKL